METLEVTFEGDRRLTALKQYLIHISVDLPYPKTFEYRQSASGIAPAVSRALKQIRKEVGRKRVREYRIKAIQM